MNFAVTADHRVNIKEGEKLITRPWQKTEEIVERVGDSHIRC